MGNYYCIFERWHRKNSHIPFYFSDIDECGAPVDPCNTVANSACNNTNGSYICQCKDGFVENGPNCEGAVKINNIICIKVPIKDFKLLVSNSPELSYNPHLVLLEYLTK